MDGASKIIILRFSALRAPAASAASFLILLISATDVVLSVLLATKRESHMRQIRNKSSGLPNAKRHRLALRCGGAFRSILDKNAMRTYRCPPRGR